MQARFSLKGLFALIMHTRKFVRVDDSGSTPRPQVATVPAHSHFAEYTTPHAGKPPRHLVLGIH
jgi:hypothetical protein